MSLSVFWSEPVWLQPLTVIHQLRLVFCVHVKAGQKMLSKRLFALKVQEDHVYCTVYVLLYFDNMDFIKMCIFLPRSL